MSAEIKYLTMTILVTSLFWVPYVLDRFRKFGLSAVNGNGPNKNDSTSPWAGRMIQAHQNAIENLVLFAPLIIIIELLDLNSPLTAMFAMIYFYARVAHIFIYSFGIGYLRTLTFAAGFASQLFLAFAILGLV